MEQIDLTTVKQVVQGSSIVSTTYFKVTAIMFDWDSLTLIIRLRGANGVSQSESYTGVNATTFIQALNKATFTVKSMHRQIIERLVADGRLAGTISGLPD